MESNRLRFFVGVRLVLIEAMAMHAWNYALRFFMRCIKTCVDAKRGHAVAMQYCVKLCVEIQICVNAIFDAKSGHAVAMQTNFEILR